MRVQISDKPAMHGGSFTHNNTVAPEEKRVYPLLSLKGKTAIVSGAGAGIGLRVAQGFAEAGANVAIWYHSNKEALDRAREIETEYGVKCRAYQVDVTVDVKVEEAIDDIVAEFDGRLDIFVANAGIPWTQGPMLDGDNAHYRKVVATDLDSTYYCAKYAGMHWRRQKKEGTTVHGTPLKSFTYGSFIATASMSGHIVNIPQPQAAYNAAKAGIIHLVKSLAVEWVRFARANSVSPGYMATEISNFIPPETKSIWRDKIPMGREGEPHELKAIPQVPTLPVMAGTVYHRISAYLRQTVSARSGRFRFLDFWESEIKGPRRACQLLRRVRELRTAVHERSSENSQVARMCPSRSGRRGLCIGLLERAVCSPSVRLRLEKTKFPANNLMEKLKAVFGAALQTLVMLGHCSEMDGVPWDLLVELRAGYYPSQTKSLAIRDEPIPVAPTGSGYCSEI
ncbi:MAG: hypothetical protein Q9185_003110 [Variospora sp. 1 TL-2023]